MLNSGLKLKFDPKFQKLCLIEIYLNKGLEVSLKGHNTKKMGLLDLDQTQKLMQEPTYEPELSKNLALLGYDGLGFKFMFQFDGEDLLQEN